MDQPFCEPFVNFLSGRGCPYFHSVRNVCKALFSFALFILMCAGVVYGLVISSNAKAARGGHGFGVSWSLQDRGKYTFGAYISPITSTKFVHSCVS